MTLFGHEIALLISTSGWR